jgi:hypothetical protein
MATKNETTKPKRDRSGRKVEKVYVSTPGVGRVYKEASGRYVAQGRKEVGGFRLRRRHATLAQAKATLKEFATSYEASKATAGE